MGEVNDKLRPIEKNFLKLYRNIEKGWYEIEFGLPAKWVYKDNKLIECELVKESDVGKMIIVRPKNANNGVSADELIEFVQLIVSVNQEIADREEEFDIKMEEEKKKIEEVVGGFYEKMDNIRKESFAKFGEEFEDVKPTPPLSQIIKEGQDPVPAKKKGRGRPPGAKNKMKVKIVTGTPK